MIKGRKQYCDKCDEKLNEWGVTLLVDSVHEKEFIDLCVECWDEFKRFIGRDD
jgi:hypothetical protein